MDTTQQMPNCNEELGEVVCPECNGMTAIEKGGYMLKCPKCQGKGKLDWCQQAVGVAPEKNNMFFSQWDSSSVSYANMVSDGTAWVRCLDKASKDLADSIDNKILENTMRSYQPELEHNENKDEVMEDGVYDHRKFSELLLFPTIESKIKNQKD